jgi:segregation and condensation protein A
MSPPPQQTKFADHLTVPAPTAATKKTAKVVQHLLYHKALVGDDDDGQRIADYITLVERSQDGEHVSLKQGLTRDIAMAFELVIQNHLDPWDIDLSKFATLYLKEAHEHGVDIVTAGRVILLAWEVLKKQSDRVAEKAIFTTQPSDDELGWEDIPDLGFSDDVGYNERILALPRAPIDEKIRHKGDRRVTLMELLDAFQEVHDEAQQRIVLNEQKLQARLALRRKMRGRLGSMMHKEDVQAEMAETWSRILDYPATPVPFSALHESEPMDLVQTFTSVLALTKEGKLALAQEELPRGEIWMTPMLKEAAAVIAEKVGA